MAATPRKPRTRGNREARPYQRTSDGKWVATVYLADGTRRPIYADSRTEVIEKRKKAQREIDDGRPLTIGKKDKLSKYLTEVWLAETLPQRVSAGKLAPRTLELAECMVEHQIIPHLGHIHLIDLGPRDIRRWLLALEEKPKQRQPRGHDHDDPVLLSTGTIARAHSTLSAALKDAAAEELIDRTNPCTLVHPPAVTPSKPPRVLTKDEVRLLLKAASEHRLWAYWLVLLGLGLRRGEGLGMRWTDLDLESGSVALEEQILVHKDGPRNPETGRRKTKLVKAKLKTKASHAALKLPELTRLALIEHRAKQKADKDAAPIWIDDSLVFTNLAGGMLHPDWVSEMWRDLCATAGVEPCGPHRLRHAAGTFLFADGVNLKVIQGLLRHTRKATTEEIYVHLLREVTDGASDVMDGVLVDLGAAQKRRAEVAATRAATSGTA